MASCVIGRITDALKECDHELNHELAASCGAAIFDSGYAALDDILKEGAVSISKLKNSSAAGKAA